ncbi:MAG: tol-pal system protein YbgF [Desulfobacterales bacterium]
MENRISHLQARNASLENQINELNDRLEQGKSQGNRIRELYAGQDAEFYELRSEVRKLSGRFEETEHRLSRKIKELESGLDATREKLAALSESVDVNDERISRLAGYLGFESAEKIEAAVDAASSEEGASKDMPEDKLYSFAKKSFDQENYETARDAFEKFLEAYPDSDKADNARFWIGEVYYSEEWYEKAILEYQKVIEEFPDGNKVAAAYLKQGIAFQKLGETGNARLVLKELIEKFPDSNEANVARQQINRIEQQ